MKPTALVLCATGVAVAALDLAHKASDGTSVAAHERSGVYVVGVLAALLAWVVAILLTRSPSIGAGGGIVAGGAAGNLASLALWPSVDGIPDPLQAGGVAFNLADLAVALGFALVLAATARFARRNAERLREPVRLRG